MKPKTEQPTKVKREAKPKAKPEPPPLTRDEFFRNLKKVARRKP